MHPHCLSKIKNETNSNCHTAAYAVDSECESLRLLNFLKLTGSISPHLPARWLRQQDAFIPPARNERMLAVYNADAIER